MFVFVSEVESEGGGDESSEGEAEDEGEFESGSDEVECDDADADEGEEEEAEVFALGCCDGDGEGYVGGECPVACFSAEDAGCVDCFGFFHWCGVLLVVWLVVVFIAVLGMVMPRTGRCFSLGAGHLVTS